MADAVLRAKLLYGLESAQLNPAVVRRLETFQLKVLRKILKMDTTYIDRANTNETVFKNANDKIKHEKGDKAKKVVSFIEASRKQKRKRASRIIRKIGSAIHKISFSNEKLQKWTHRNRRVGRPRLNWTEETIREIWEHIKESCDEFKYTVFNDQNIEIINKIKEYANSEGREGEIND